jgi:hypothetical protein
MVNPAYIVTTAIDLMILGGTWYSLELFNSIRIDHLIRNGKKWDEIKYKTPLSRFLVDKKSL